MRMPAPEVNMKVRQKNVVGREEKGEPENIKRTKQLPDARKEPILGKKSSFHPNRSWNILDETP